jgi:hypothetical protein
MMKLMWKKCKDNFFWSRWQNFRSAILEAEEKIAPFAAKASSDIAPETLYPYIVHASTNNMRNTK